MDILQNPWIRRRWRLDFLHDEDGTLSPILSSLVAKLILAWQFSKMGLFAL
ncbi:hypothetical protein ABK249_08280 [Neorhizobium sp. Rsf11]|uniref:Uncharacterized protein n=1 Tax=Neorhizobium phenanthreniclasticum TaxID=3157917 RepID=A0ABV0LZA2_9HYPH|nr:hypothetical protein [Neorhizobium petrolearium]MCC2610920.1 hypothetical protein [Neorhizobium petrolearium]